MSMSIVISDQAAAIVQASMSAYGSAEAFIESAIFRVHAEVGQDEDTEWMRQAVEEGLKSGIRKWDPDQFEKDAHAILAARRTEPCKIA